MHKRSGDYVGKQGIRGNKNLILEDEFSFFQALKLEAIEASRNDQCIYCYVQIAMFHLEFSQSLFQDFLIIDFCHIAVRPIYK